MISLSNIDNNNNDILNSSISPTLNGSIEHAKTNKIILDNISTYYNYNDITFSTNFLNKYRNVIESYITEIQIKKDLFYRPEYVSLIIYGTTDLWYLILFVNNMTSSDEFKNEKIKIFNPAYIDIFNDIIEKEYNNINNSRNSPIELKENLIKDLNKPSKEILPDVYNKKIKPIEI